jgi:type VI secretion system secreted protein VgrG
MTRSLLDDVGAPDVLPALDLRVTIRPVSPTDDALDEQGSDSWRVRHLLLEEELDAPYSLTLTLVTDDTLLDVDRLVGGELELELWRADEEQRRVHGIVLSAEYLGTHARQLFARVVVGPALALLALTERSRIFQGQSAVEIARAVVGPCFAERGRSIVVDRLADVPPTLDYCVQHRETDLHFLQRILAEAGIAYVWDHGGDSEAMVLIDRNEQMSPLGHGAAETIEDPAPTPVAVLSGRAADGDVAGLGSVRWVRRASTAAHEIGAWDWKLAPGTRLSASVAPAEPEPWEIGERYDHDPCRLPQAEAGEGPHLDLTVALADRAAERTAVEGAWVEGRGNLVRMTAGATIELHGHPNPHLDRELYVTRVVHRADVPHADLASGDEDGAAYENELEAVPLEHPYRPRRLPKPSIGGPRLATVVGPPGEDIHTDVFGRIKVWMHWDREGEASESHDLSCWIRVVQLLAGPGYGALFLPRVGMEVVVAFLDGDPDRPLVTGCVYGGQHPPPYDLPAERTRSTIRTATSPGGPSEGFNELRFEDARGREQIWLHAQRAFDERVGASHSTTVGVDQTLRVRRDRDKTVGGNETHTIEGNRTARVGGSEQERIAGGRLLEVDCTPAEPGGPPGVDATRVQGERTVWARYRAFTEVGPTPGATTTLEITPDEVVFKAGTRFRIEVGGATLEITPGGIRLAAPAVELAAKASTLALDERAELRSDNATSVKQGVAALKLEKHRARLKSRHTVLDVTTSPNAARLELAEEAKLSGVSVALKPSVGDSHVRVNATSVTSYAETMDHHALYAYKVRSVRIDLN